MKFRKGSSKRKSAESGYTYTNTRVKALKSKLLGSGEMGKFMKMSLPEIARFLQETEYNKEISELSVKYSGANLIEYALNRNMERTFAKILHFSMQQAKGQIRLYLRRYDIANIKTIMRGKFAKAPNESIINELIASGEFSREFLEKIVRESANMEEAVEHFRRTKYYYILKNYSGDMTRMEDQLDELYYAMLLEYSGKELRDYIRKEIFAKNTLNKLRAKKAGIKAVAIPGEARMKFSYEDDSLDARLAMKRLLLQQALRMVHEVRRNIRPVLGYFIAKENEVSNIRILIRGRHNRLKEEVIQKLVI